MRSGTYAVDSIARTGMMYLVDTNVLSQLVRKKPDGQVVSWTKAQSQLHLSVITIEEVFFGLNLKPSARIEQWFINFVRRYCSVLPVTDKIAERCGRMRAHFRSVGRPLTQADMLIASTAFEHQLTLVTRNVKDFQQCGIPLLNPFSSSPL